MKGPLNPVAKPTAPSPLPGLDPLNVDRAPGSPHPAASSPAVIGAAPENPLRVRGHVPTLDGLRGLALLLVLLAHFTPAGQSRTLIGAVTKAVAGVGSAGVDLFFVLSGFLITGILLDAKHKPHYFRTFYARRTLRIFPLYYAVLVVTFLIVPALRPYPSPGHHQVAAQQGWLWLYGSNIKSSLTTDERPFSAGWIQMDHFWSLAVEEHFYLAWPLVVYLAAGRRLGAACLLMIGVAPVIRTWLYLRGDDTLAFNALTPCRMDQLAMGCLVAILARHPTAATRLARAAPLVLLGTGTLLLTLWNTEIREMVLGGTMLGVFFSALLITVLSARSQNPLKRAFQCPPFRLLGKYSYGMYVLHPFLLAVLTTYLPHDRLGRFAHSGPVGVLLFMTLAFAATLAAGWLSWNLFEKHFLKLKRFFEYPADGSPRPVLKRV
jgi:peptidoglycan/LPS O-acetylase OafA/YrhL